MDLADLLRRVAATPLDRAAQAPYVAFALEYFRDPLKIAAPELSCCVELDLTAADAAYRAGFAATPGASFTAYLTWRMLQATAEVPPLLWRRIDGAWYHIADPPLFCPVATGTANTFRHLFLEHVAGLGWEDFAARYRAGVDRALATPTAPPEPIEPELYRLSCFIGNLPYLAFTSLTLHRHPDPSGRAVCYFGQRRRTAAGGLACPLAVQFDHANADPWQVQALLTAFARLSAQPRS